MTAPITVRYAVLDALPARVRTAAVAHVHGDLLPRLEAVVALRRALMAGRVPDAESLGWPEPELCALTMSQLREGDLARFCENNDDLTDDVLLEWLDVAQRIERFRRRAVRAMCAGAKPPGEVDPEDLKRWRATLTASEWEGVERQAAMLALRFAQEQASTALNRSWQSRTAAWGELEAYFDVLFAHTFAPPGRGRGWLKSVARHDVTALRHQLSALPPLADLIRTLGRMLETDDPDAPSVFERVVGPIRRRRWVDREIDREPIAEIRGIERSGEVARMLGSESALLTRPTLRRLFVLRMVERTLVTYHAEGVLTRRIQTEDGASEGLETIEKRANRGPIIVVLDTSGSMAGAVGDVAAALVLQIACLAHLEGRPVSVLAFSGPGDLIELDLSLEARGIAALLGFLSVRFGGGTVIDAALGRAMEMVGMERLSYADLVIVTDGQMYVDRSTLARLREVKGRRDVRVHAIITGNRRLESLSAHMPQMFGPQSIPPNFGSFAELVDVQHDLADWARHDA